MSKKEKKLPPIWSKKAPFFKIAFVCRDVYKAVKEFEKLGVGGWKILKWSPKKGIDYENPRTISAFTQIIPTKRVLLELMEVKWVDEHIKKAGYLELIKDKAIALQHLSAYVENREAYCKELEKKGIKTKVAGITLGGLTDFAYLDTLGTHGITVELLGIAKEKEDKK